MNKVVGDKDNDYKHFDLIIGHHTEHETRNRHAEQPLSDIIAKFHKIKEDRFKSKDKNPFTRPKSPEEIHKNDDHIQFETRSRPQRLESLIENRPQSASEDSPQGGVFSYMGARGGGRRMSLPSIFHPVTPRPVYSGSPDIIEKEEKEIKVYHPHRRHSMSHVMTEYSKHDLQHLSKIHELRIKELNEIADPSKEKKKHKHSKLKPKEEEERAKWLTGEDIHAFYNMWESKGKKSHWKKRLHFRKILPRGEAAADDGEDRHHRPRVFSF